MSRDERESESASLRLTHLLQEFIDVPVEVVTGEVELVDDSLRLFGEGHCDRSRGGMRGREGRRNVADRIWDVEAGERR